VILAETAFEIADSAVLTTFKAADSAAVTAAPILVIKASTWAILLFRFRDQVPLLGSQGIKETLFCACQSVVPGSDILAHCGHA